MNVLSKETVKKVVEQENTLSK